MVKHAIWIALCLSLVSAPALADDADAAALAKAHAFVIAAMPGQCDEMAIAGDASYPDEAAEVSWKRDGGDASQPEERATLYQIFCGVGAYNTIYAYAYKPENGELSLVSFAQPTFTVEYVEGDDLYTELKAPPKATGILATPILVNSFFDPKRNTITSFAKWRGTGDAWSSGTWELRDGQFVLTEYEIDPIYEGNLDAPTDEQHDLSFKIYP